MPDACACTVCGWRPAVAKGRCRCDYEYRRRYGKDRSADLVQAHVKRRNDGHAR